MYFMSRQDEYFSLKYCFAGEAEKIPAILDAYKKNETVLSDVNRVLELHNIRLFFDKYDSVSGWSLEKYNYYSSLAKDSKKDVVKFFCSMNAMDLVSIHDNCDVVFWDDFWSLFYQFKVYERIPKESFANVMNGMRVSPNHLLSNKAFVNFFDAEIAEMLRIPSFGASFIIDYYLRKRDEKEKYYIPKSLTKEDNYNTVKQYVEGPDVNANALYLIFNGKTCDPNAFLPDDRLRYLAKIRYEEFWNEKSHPIIKPGKGISISFLPDNPDRSLEFSDGNIIAKYNSDWIINNLDYPTLLNNFIYLFGYVDKQMQCSLTLEALQPGVIENVFIVDGNGMYKPGQTFWSLNGLADIQMLHYARILNDQNIYIEDLAKWFFEEYLDTEFSAKGFVCLMPDHNDSLLSKYERVASVMDGLTKQYKLFCEDGIVDRGLYEMSSGSIRFNTIPSQLKHKYAYSQSSDLNREAASFFSDQNLLSYTKRHEIKYNTLFDLLAHEEISFDDVMEYNIDTYNWLIERGSICVSEGKLVFNPERLFVLRELYNKKVICLNYIESKTIKDLIACGELIEENTLLSRPESRYFDFFLNKAEFSDGLDLRNKYIHDTGSLDKKTQTHDYYTLLKLMIILIIKINEDFCLYDEIKKGGQDYYEL